MVAGERERWQGLLDTANTQRHSLHKPCRKSSRQTPTNSAKRTNIDQNTKRQLQTEADGEPNSFTDGEMYICTNERSRGRRLVGEGEPERR